MGGASPGGADGRLGPPPSRSPPAAHRATEVGGRVNHPIYHVRGFEIVGCYVLRVAFDDGTAQSVNLNLCWRENSSGHSAIRHFFGRSGSIPRSIRSYGPTAPISIRPRCTTGQTTSKRSSAGRAAGRPPRIAPSEETR